MNRFKLIICEDNESLIPVLESYCIELNKKYEFIDYEFWSFQNLLKIDNSFETKCNLIVLDLLDESNSKDLLGLRVLEIIKSRNIKIPVIIYTSFKDAKGSTLNINDLKRDYPFGVFLQKYDIGQSTLKDEIELKIKEKLDNQFEVDTDYINEFKKQLHFFGNSKINEILFEIKKKHYIPINQKIKLQKLKSGFSGAILFRYSYNNTDYVLKLSKDIQLIENELAKAKELYPLFPPKFYNYIDPKEFYTSSKDTIAIVIKLIPNSTTLFEYILKSTSKLHIENIFNEIYHKDGLKSHYATQLKGTESWTTIYNKFKDGWFNTIIEVHNELKPLLINFNLSEVQNLLEKDDFKNLNRIKITHNGTLTLNHLDLHSKNILIQGENKPFLIDTGVMDYGYWCFDICRLLVDLLINGVDINTKLFYDINSIQKNIELGESIINLKMIEYDSNNDRIIDSINWLTSNVEAIYSDYFSLWEFQLGLMKELLQMSYRTGSVPHSKRALALELAYICMIEAEINAS